MPKSPARSTRKTRAGQGRVGQTRGGNRQDRAKRSRKDRATSDASRSTNEHAYIIENDRATYVLVPVDEYEELIKAGMVQHAIAQIERGDDDFIDADDFALELAAERIVEARKAKGLTQKQLGARLSIPQSQISRIERNPDRTTVRTLKRIAKALGVDVRALV